MKETMRSDKAVNLEASHTARSEVTANRLTEGNQTTFLSSKEAARCHDKLEDLERQFREEAEKSAEGKE